MAKGGSTNGYDLEGRIEMASQFSVFALDVNRINTREETRSAIRSQSAN